MVWVPRGDGANGPAQAYMCVSFGDPLTDDNASRCGGLLQRRRVGHSDKPTQRQILVEPLGRGFGCSLGLRLQRSKHALGDREPDARCHPPTPCGSIFFSSATSAFVVSWLTGAEAAPTIGKAALAAKALRPAQSSTAANRRLVRD